VLVYDAVVASRGTAGCLAAARHARCGHRGIGADRAAGAPLTVVEAVLGTRLPGFEDLWRY
jgi:hypothetical protein